ncbi:MAG: folylpolyglutamate synthase/dihydrofolate synthase family protein [Candidatus Omnitrophota bacterium]|nr:folylpolyglutamate synthase/dihydrofolate synthase family protein [Candidatus Omnitrophota bacterium]
MTYPEAIRYLNSLANYEKNINYSYKETIKLERVRDFLSLIGNPQKSLRVIHVAGTKGKGSTCAFMAYILREAGFCVGLYTSPHLNDFRERIRILCPLVLRKRSPAKDFEGMISKGALLSLVQELKPVINKYNRQSKYGALSFFEAYTSIAFLYFKREQIDFAVLETGMGGRLDATNTANSLACGITPVSLEHTQKLGKTLAKISKEKAGIIKSKGAIVISALQNKAAAKVIYNRCKKFQARFFEVGRQIKYFKAGPGFTIKGLRKIYKHLRLRLLGAHQMANASLAVGLVEVLSFYGFNIGSRAIRKGLYNTIWPGRCEVIQKNPLIILDGAQNLASAQVLRKTIKDNFSATNRGGSAFGGRYRKLILVLGISADKDIAGICRTLSPLADEIILTRAATSRAADPEKLAGYFKRKLHLTPSVKEAKLLAKSLAGEKDLILVTGSLFVAGEFRDVGR